MPLIQGNFSYDFFNSSSNTASASPAGHKYGSTTDNFATVTASGYFDDLLGTTVFTSISPAPLRVGDIIHIKATDAVELVKITGLYPITVQAITGGDTGVVYPTLIPDSSHRIYITSDSAPTGQGVGAIAVGDSAGLTNQGADAVAIGLNAGQTNQGISSISIGVGSNSQGLNSIAMGINATVQGSNSIAIGTGSVVGPYTNSISLGTGASAIANNQAVLPAGVSWSLNQINDLSNLESIGVNTRRLIANDGVTLLIDWQNTWLFDSSGNPSINWGSREIFDETGQQAVIYFSGSRFLKDNSSLTSVDWNNRQLIANDGSTLKMDWSDPNMTTFNSIQGIEFAIVPGVAPIANYIKVNGAPTGNSPIFTSVGSDPDVAMTFMTQGAGSIDFTSSTTTLLLLANQTGAVNNFSMSVATTGNSPVLAVGGTDTNVGLKFLTQGSGGFSFSGGTGQSFFINNLASAPVNFLEVSAANTGADPTLSALGGDLNVNLQLAAQNSGFVYTNNGFQANNGFTANDNTSVASIDSNARQLLDSTGVQISVDWDTKQLFANGGSVVAADFSQIAGVKFQGLQVYEVSNGKQGVATLAGGTVVVSNTNITANSRIFLTAQDNNTLGSLRVSARTALTSFTITSSLNTDNGVVAYEIFEPA